MYVNFWVGTKFDLSLFTMKPRWNRRLRITSLFCNSIRLNWFTANQSSWYDANLMFWRCKCAVTTATYFVKTLRLTVGPKQSALNWYTWFWKQNLRYFRCFLNTFIWKYASFKSNVNPQSPVWTRSRTLYRVSILKWSFLKYLLRGRKFITGLISPDFLATRNKVL